MGRHLQTPPTDLLSPPPLDTGNLPAAGAKQIRAQPQSDASPRPTPPQLLVHSGAEQTKPLRCPTAFQPRRPQRGHRRQPRHRRDRPLPKVPVKTSPRKMCISRFQPRYHAIGLENRASGGTAKASASGSVPSGSSPPSADSTGSLSVNNGARGSIAWLSSRVHMGYGSALDLAPERVEIGTGNRLPQQNGELIVVLDRLDRVIKASFGIRPKRVSRTASRSRRALSATNS